MITGRPSADKGFQPRYRRGRTGHDPFPIQLATMKPAVAGAMPLCDGAVIHVLIAPAEVVLHREYLLSLDSHINK